jgi:hypothetical protein
LKEKGYSEPEIIQATYQFSYDGKPNPPVKVNEITAYYEQHPDQADEVAKAILGELAQREREKLMANTVASQIGDTQTTSYYEVQTADQIGFPYYTIFFITLFIGLLGLKFQWLNSYLTFLTFLPSLYFGFLWIQHWRSNRKQK